MHSRDELRDRSVELEPAWHELGDGTKACYPIDPDGGGTWVAAHENGFYIGLINLNLSDDELDPDRPIANRSRGLLIPELIKLGNAQDANTKLDQMDLRGFSPFRMVLIGKKTSGEYEFIAKRFDGVQLEDLQQFSALNHPVCYASSGLGDKLVQCRVPLFESSVAIEPNIENQRQYHRHQWEDRPELSVMMSRPDARTSSVTSVLVEGGNQPKILYDRFPIGDPVCDPVGAGMLR